MFVLFFLIPLGLIVMVSFWDFNEYELLPAFTLRNYAAIFEGCSTLTEHGDFCVTLSTYLSTLKFSFLVWLITLVLGALGMWICGAWVYIGGRTTPALNIGLIYAASPILVVALGRLLYRERLTTGRLAGIVLCLAGVAAVFAKGRELTLVFATVALIVVFVELWAIVWIQNRFMETPFLRAALQVVVGGALVFAAGALIGGG